MSGNTNYDIWIAGAVAAFTVDVLIYPLDTLKTRLQSPQYKKVYLHASTQRINTAVLFRGLYQGVGSVILPTLPSSGAFFTTYEAVKSTLSAPEDALGRNASLIRLPQPIVNSLASAAAELVSCAIIAPGEVVKQNAQMLDTRSSGISASSSTLATLSRFKSNPLALWTGYFALAGRNLPYTALHFPIFEWLKEGIKRRRVEQGKRNADSLVENGMITVVSAAMSGSFAAVVTTPVDVVKTRVMLAAADNAADVAAQTESAKSVPSTDKVKSAVKNVMHTPTRKSSRAITKEILAESGVKGLFRGGALRAIWTMLGSGVYLGMYETTRVWLARRRGDDITPENDIL